MNKVFLIGNITRDLELKTTPSGKKVVNTGIAINRKYKVEGETREEVCFVDIAIWNKQAETACEYLHKGSKVLAEGRLNFSSWEKDGDKRSKLDVIVQNLTFLDSKNNDESANGSNNPVRQQKQESYYGGNDDIPF